MGKQSSQSCGQTYKRSTIVNCDSVVVQTRYLPLVPATRVVMTAFTRLPTAVVPP